MEIQQSYQYEDTSAENVMLCGSFTKLAELNYLCIYTLYYFGSRIKKNFFFLAKIPG